MEIKPWDRVLEVMPFLSQSENSRLEESIKEHGVLNPIFVLPDGRIIDGYHRWRIVGESIPYKVLDLDEETAFVLAISLNADRRQLSFEQLAELKKKMPNIIIELRSKGFSQPEIAEITKVSQPTVSRVLNGNNIQMNNTSVIDDLRYSIPRQAYNQIFERHQSGETQEKIADDFKITRRRVGQIIELVKVTKKVSIGLTENVPFQHKQYNCLVIDPPWPINWIERSVRPNQGNRISYPTMSLEEIEALPITDLSNSDGCHVYLWVTHRFLPDGLNLFEKWGVKYQCVLTWKKNVGFTPYSWMYDTEHVLFGKIGSLQLDKIGVRLCFEAPVREHSRKPDIFYDIVREVSSAPRLDMFAREKHEGFDVWGNEVDKFSEEKESAIVG